MNSSCWFRPRRARAGFGALVTAFLLGGCSARVSGEPELELGPGAAAFPLEEATVEQLQAGMREGRYTARSLAEAYLARIEALDRRGPELHAMLDLNPDALGIADRLDTERAAGRERGPLHGIPIVVKDNVDTADRMTTTAGALALAGNVAAEDAGIVRRLREAGVVILGKTNLSEWANFRSTRSSSGWSGRGGQTRNPYALDRSPCGSSSGTGVAIAANLAAVGVGTETDGSIVCPAATNGLVGLKPTVGLVSRAGIIPISGAQDIAGPMTRTVADAAVLLNALAGPDPRDPVTAAGAEHARQDYTHALDANGLRGARIGVVRRRVTGYSPQTDRLFEEAIERMRQAGATVVDSVDIPHLGEYDDDEFEVLLHEFKDGVDRYLAGSRAPVRSLAEVIQWNQRNADRSMPWFGQELLELAQSRGPLTDTLYVNALERGQRLARRGLDSALRLHRLDALVAPTGSPAWPIDLINGDHFTGASSTAPAVAGYPNLTVPMGEVAGLPVGISFVGTAWSEPTLLRLGYAFEQATRHRRAPAFRATVEYR